MVTTPLFPLTLTGAEVRRKGRRILGPVDLTIPQGGVTAVIGPNGAGKSTLLRVMHGVERLSAGQVDWAVPAATAQARLAYVFQQPIMLRRSVAENLAYPLRLLGLGRAARAAAVQDWARRIDMGEMLSQQATRLSGGEQQKLALARALIRKPDVLFLDEPCANLDGAATREIEGLLAETHAAGTTVLLVTHDIGQVRRLATDILFVHHGRIAEAGAAAELLGAPQTEALRAYLNGDIVT